MKKLVGAFTVFLSLFIFSTSPVFAHTHLDTSDPEEGSTVTETLDQIILYFETVIENSAVIELHAEDGTEVILDNIAVNDDTLSADVTEPLENGIYTIRWDIIGVDGHPMEDSISFEVDIEESIEEEQEEENIDSVEDVEKTETTSEEQMEDNETSSENNVQETAINDTNSNTMLIAILLVAMIAVVAIVLLKRKK